MEQPPSDKPALARKGNLLVVQKGAMLPALCVKCGQPVVGDPAKKTYYWHSPWIFLTILIGVLIYVIIAVVVRKKFELPLPLCEEHRQRSRRVMWVGLGLFVGPILAAIFLSGFIPDGYGGWWALAIVVTSLSGAFYFDSGRPKLSPAYIDDREAHFKGAGEPFLAQLPTVS